MKKAQLQAQPFVYILIIIIVALMFIFGFRLVYHLQDKAELVKYTVLKQTLETELKSISASGKGTLHNYAAVSIHKPLLVPKHVKYVCFKTSDIDYNPELVEDITIIDTKYLSLPNRNVFLFPHNTKFEAFSLGNIKPKPNPSCILVKNNQLSFTLENLGDKIEIRSYLKE